MLQEIIDIFIVRKNFSVIELVKYFISGGQGPGSYYFPVMLQIILMFPIINHVINLFKVKGLIGCFIANLGFEVIKTMIGMHPSLYRICALRYIFILAYGCYLYQHQSSHKIKNIYYLIGGLGCIYIFLFKYTNLQPVFTDQWTGTSVFAVLFIIPVTLYLTKQTKIHNKMIELLGKASFNIFLVQMLYYWYFANKFYALIHSTFLRLAFNIIVCCSFGILFYLAEYPITQRIVKKLRR